MGGGWFRVSGKDIAGRWCAQCHLVDGGRARGAAPPLPAIARDVSWTDDRLAAFLTKPHGGMRGFSLSRQDIENLVAYIRSPLNLINSVSQRRIRGLRYDQAQQNEQAISQVVAAKSICVRSCKPLLRR